MFPLSCARVRAHTSFTGSAQRKKVVRTQGFHFIFYFIFKIYIKLCSLIAEIDWVVINKSYKNRTALFAINFYWDR